MNGQLYVGTEVDVRTYVPSRTSNRITLCHCIQDDVGNRCLPPSPHEICNSLPVLLRQAAQLEVMK